MDRTTRAVSSGRAPWRPLSPVVIRFNVGLQPLTTTSAPASKQPHLSAMFFCEIRLNSPVIARCLRRFLGTDAFAALATSLRQVRATREWRASVLLLFFVVLLECGRIVRANSLLSRLSGTFWLDREPHSCFYLRSSSLNGIPHSATSTSDGRARCSRASEGALIEKTSLEGNNRFGACC